MDIKLYEYNFGSDYEDTDVYRGLSNSSLNFTPLVINYNLTPINSIENYTFKVPNSNGLLWKGMSYGEGEIVVEYLITKGSGSSIEQNISDFITNYLGYYSQTNNNNKFDKKLVLVSSEEYSNQGHMVVVSDVNSATVTNNQSVVLVKFLKLEPHVISRLMYTSSSSVSTGGTITLNTNYLTTIDTPPYITMTFNASCTNPVLTAEDNTYIRLVEDFSINDTVIINCEAKTITINGANGLYALDYSSTFFNVNSVYNTIVFTTSSGGASTSISINWYKRWIG
jgi:phage-related protein